MSNTHTDSRSHSPQKTTAKKSPDPARQHLAYYHTSLCENPELIKKAQDTCRPMLRQHAGGCGDPHDWSNMLLMDTRNSPGYKGVWKKNQDANMWIENKKLMLIQCGLLAKQWPIPDYYIAKYVGLILDVESRVQYNAMQSNL